MTAASRPAISRRAFTKACGITTLWLATQTARAAGETPPLRIGLVTDAHCADRDPKGTRHFRASTGRLRAAIESFNAAQVDLVVQLGDLVDKGPDPLPAALALFAASKAPVVHLAGNHDFDNGAEGVAGRLGLDTSTPARGARSESRNGWRLLYLNGSAVSTYAWPPDSDSAREAADLLAKGRAAKAPNAQTWNGALGTGQRDWLRDQLKAAATSHEHVIVFCHFPIHDATGSHDLWDAPEIRALLAEAPHVAAWINGHNHAGGYVQKGPTHHVNLRAVVETPDSPAFAIATLHADRIEIAGTGREVSRDLATA